MKATPLSIHPQAVVSPRAQVGRRVSIGPFCLVEDDVRLGDGCRLESHVVVRRGTTLGADNHLSAGVVIGGTAQHLLAGETHGNLVIGSRNTLRENCTIHRALRPGDATVIGDDNYLMVNSHVAHDCRIGDHTVLANNVMLAGHVTIEDRAFLSGAVGVHQFCRVGRHAMVGGQARVCQDVLPFVLIDGECTKVVGLNRVGLRRHGFTREEMVQLKAAYDLIYRSELAWREVLQRLHTDFAEGPAACLYDFCRDAGRGIVQQRRAPPTPTLKLHRADDPPSHRAKAG